MLKQLSAALVLFCSGDALGAAGYTYVETGNLISSLSYDGTAGAGNVLWDYSYETFRWTSVGGVERLGRASVPVINQGAGTPDISFSGRQVSASILSTDVQLTQGLWDAGTGWTETMPDSPPGGALVDSGYGSAWGLSGNGQTLTGFFWTPAYRAQACAWSAQNGFLALEQVPGRSARANGVSYDGSVVGGWEENEWGSWMPRAWRNGVKFDLDERDGGVNMVEHVNGNGSILCGSSRNDDVAINVATLWRWNGTSYDIEQVGSLPDFSPNQSTCSLLSISDDGSIAVGVHSYSWDYGVGIVWTPAGGLVLATDFFAENGVFLPETLAVLDCSAVSGDGSTISATCLDTEVFEYVTVLVVLRQPCPGDLNNDRQVDDADFVLFASQYDTLDCADPAMPGYCRADLSNDGMVEDADFVLFAQAYDQLVCP